MAMMKRFDATLIYMLKLGLGLGLGLGLHVGRGSGDGVRVRVRVRVSDGVRGMIRFRDGALTTRVVWLLSVLRHDKV
jgi:hypothetical protein